MGTAVRRGRAFGTTDIAGAQRVAVVNETMARLYWPGEDPVGKCLKVGGYVDLVFAVIGREHFAKIHSAAFGSDCPQHVGQILSAETAGRPQMLQFCADGEASDFAVNLCATADVGHQISATKIHRSRSAAMPVIDGLGCAGVDVHAKNRHLIVRSSVLVALLGRILRENSGRKDHDR